MSNTQKLFCYFAKQAALGKPMGASIPKPSMSGPSKGTPNVNMGQSPIQLPNSLQMTKTQVAKPIQLSGQAPVAPTK